MDSLIGERPLGSEGAGNLFKEFQLLENLFVGTIFLK